MVEYTKRWKLVKIKNIEKLLKLTSSSVQIIIVKFIRSLLCKKGKSSKVYTFPNTILYYIRFLKLTSFQQKNNKNTVKCPNPRVLAVHRTLWECTIQYWYDLFENHVQNIASNYFQLTWSYVKCLYVVSIVCGGDLESK